LSFEGMEQVVMAIEKNLNNRPLTYVEGETESKVLTPNVIMCGEEMHTHWRNWIQIRTSWMNRRLINAKQHAWQRSNREYIHALMETHRTKPKGGSVPDVGDILLIVGNEKNRGEWKKGRVIRLVKGKDSVARGVGLCHNGRRIDSEAFKISLSIGT
jgi:hypothetical protein